jgi:hypothetical protein
VQRWDRLNERQLQLLQRIGARDDLSSSTVPGERNSARGLQTRRLVQISRKGGVWRAVITDAGRFYLEHGFHPDHPERLGLTQEDPEAGSDAMPPER